MKDITGNVYGKLTVIEMVGKNKEGRSKWLCKCECGGSGIYYKNNLDSYRTHCGCEANNKPNLKHGMRHHPLYSTWASMIGRCTNKKSQDYPNYGGRGITVCQEWASDPARFFSDMGERPAGTSLDRIDNEKGYSKDNCRWATNAQQHANRRITVKFSDGRTVDEVAREAGVSDRTLYMRLYRGWTEDEAISGRRAKAKNAGLAGPT